VADLLADTGSEIEVNVDGPGTGDGFELFCNGETDISDASRPIQEEEAAACEQNGVEYIELPVGFDGLSVLTSAENTDVECLTFADLYALLGPESQGVDNWSDAQPLATELGSSTELPDAPLDITGPGEESGTYDSFIELAFGDIAEERLAAGEITEGQAETTRPDYTASGDDNVILQGIEGGPTSLGWVGYAFAQQAGDALTPLPISDGEGECTDPSAETIADGSYPLSRTLYIYVNKAEAEENPAVAAYVDYYLGDGYTSVEDVGYVALPDDQLSDTTQTWESRSTGTRAEAS
jgi:phosphate transport system substrate-binding protein